MIGKCSALVALGLVLAACSSPEAYETEPVVVNTAAGPVTCQLYTRTLHSWDRSIDRPESMDVDTADAICRKEGRERG
ncbi:hypothetical protein ACMA5I_09415 [Paracoccaceae bacterium GXU_MW_L88]